MLKMLWLIISFCFSCNESHTRHNEQKKISLRNNTSFTIVDSNATPVTLIDTITKEKNEDFPLLIIENCAALWPLACNAETFRDDGQIVKNASTYFKYDSLISLGSEGVLDQNILNSFCMQGECGGNQIAFKLKNKECFGILASKQLLNNTKEFSPLKQVEPNELKHKIENYTDTSLLGSTLYSDSLQNTLIQVVGKGYFQENQWPLYTDINWRILTLSDTKWVIQQSDTFNIQSTNLPKPIGILISDLGKKIIWYHGEGICCPSNSTAWISKIDFLKNGTVILSQGKISPGGLGQPCD